MPSQPKAAVHLTKLAAAQRQMDAAIRMELSGEDDLAIHTVASAAYRVLRDLKQNRGRNELADKLHFSTRRRYTIPP